MELPFLPGNEFSRRKSMKKTAIKRDGISLYNGFLVGIPAFLGYCSEIADSFLNLIIVRAPISKGRSNRYWSSTVRFRTLIALAASSNSASILLLFIAIKQPPTSIKGAQYSSRTGRGATALAVAH